MTINQVFAFEHFARIYTIFVMLQMTEENPLSLIKIISNDQTFLLKKKKTISLFCVLHVPFLVYLQLKIFLEKIRI